MEKVIKLKNIDEAKALFGTHDENLKIIEKEFGVKIATRGDALKLDGEAKQVELASTLLDELILTVRNGAAIKKHELLYAIHAIKEDETRDINSSLG